MKVVEEKTYYQRMLPHYQPLYASFFVTFRLAGSLPKEVIINLKEEQHKRENEISKIKDERQRMKNLIEQRKLYFGKFDKYLDEVSSGPVWLEDNRIAKIVVDDMQKMDGTNYDLIAFCIMPNHVHLLVDDVDRALTRDVNIIDTGSRAEARATIDTQNTRYHLTRILRLIKGRSALEANKVLKRIGSFWQHESYDHVVRDGKEEERIIWYILNNPVKAGYVRDWREWKWSYCKYEM